MNNTELAAAGRQFRDLMSSDTALIEIAKMISNLADKLDVTTLALREACKERDALAVENAGLKSVAQSVYDEMESHHDTDGLFCYDADGEPMDALLRLCDAQSTVESLLLKSETPATDAAIAAIQAQGADAVAAHHHKQAELLTGPYSEMLHVHRYGCNAAKHVAAQLRKGDTHD